MNTLTVQQNVNEQATIYKSLIVSKKKSLTRQAYRLDLTSFAEFLTTNNIVNIPQEVNKHPLEFVPDEAWQQLDTSHIALYLEWLKQQVSDKTKRPYSSATIARKMTAIREFLTEAMYQGHFSKEKLDYIKNRLDSVEVSNIHHSNITPSEQDNLLTFAASQPGLKGLRDYALFRLWLDTGLRRFELAALKVSDLTIRGEIDTVIVRKAKKNATRKIGLEQDTANVVREWLEKSGQDNSPDNPIFCQVRKFGRGDNAEYRTVNTKKHIAPANLYQLVLWYKKKCDIKSDIVCHSFRVALVTDMLDGNAPIQHVQAVTGHTTTRMITEVYDRNKYAKPLASYRTRDLPKRD